MKQVIILIIFGLSLLSCETKFKTTSADLKAGETIEERARTRLKFYYSPISSKKEIVSLREKAETEGVFCKIISPEESYYLTEEEKYQSTTSTVYKEYKVKLLESGEVISVYHFAFHVYDALLGSPANFIYSGWKNPEGVVYRAMLEEDELGGMMSIVAYSMKNEDIPEKYR